MYNTFKAVLPTKKQQVKGNVVEVQANATSDVNCLGQNGRPCLEGHVQEEIVGDEASNLFTSTLQEVPELIHTLDLIEASLLCYDFNVISEDRVELYPNDLMLKKTVRLIPSHNEGEVYDLNIQLTKIPEL